MQVRLCPGQPFGVAASLLIHPVPGKHPETTRPLAPCSEETDAKIFNCCPGQARGELERYRAALGVFLYAHPSPTPTRTAGPSQPRLEPARLQARLLNGGLCSLVTTRGPRDHGGTMRAPIPKTEVGGLRKTTKESGSQDCAGVIAGAPFVTATLPCLYSGYLVCAVCSD